MSVISPEINFHDIEICCLLGCGAFSSVKLVRTPVAGVSAETPAADDDIVKFAKARAHSKVMIKQSRRHGLMYGDYEYFAMKMMARSYIVDNGWEQMVEQERLAMIEIATSSPISKDDDAYQEDED